MRKFLIPFYLLTSTLGTLTLWAPEACAGFDWTPPEHTAPQQQGPAVEAAPVAPVYESSIDSSSADKSGVSLNMWPMGSNNNNSYAPGAVERQPVVSIIPENYAIAEGFGRDLPLALVLSQIVPPDYAHSFDPAVDPGQIVSWNGGKPWNVVLQDMLTPLRLSLSIQGKTVRISRAGAAAPPVPLAQKSEEYSTPARILVAPTAFGNTAASGPTPLPDEIETKNENRTLASQGPFASRQWQARGKDTLRQTLAAWCAQAGIKLLWDAKDDFRLPQEINREGTFADAVQELLGLYAGTSPPLPKGSLHTQTPDGIAVLVITSETITN